MLIYHIPFSLLLFTSIEATSSAFRTMSSLQKVAFLWFGWLWSVCIQWFHWLGFILHQVLHVNLRFNLLLFTWHCLNGTPMIFL